MDKREAIVMLIHGIGLGILLCVLVSMTVGWPLC
jgi:hypothetical protein